MRQLTRWVLVQVMACRLFTTKLLPEAILANCQLDSREQISDSEFYHFHSTNALKIDVCQNGVIFVGGGGGSGVGVLGVGWGCWVVGGGGLTTIIRTSRYLMIIRRIGFWNVLQLFSLHNKCIKFTTEYNVYILYERYAEIPCPWCILISETKNLTFPWHEIKSYFSRSLYMPSQCHSPVLCFIPKGYSSTNSLPSI